MYFLRKYIYLVLNIRITLEFSDRNFRNPKNHSNPIFLEILDFKISEFRIILLVPDSDSEFFRSESDGIRISIPTCTPSHKVMSEVRLSGLGTQGLHGHYNYFHELWSNKLNLICVCFLVFLIILFLHPPNTLNLVLIIFFCSDLWNVHLDTWAKLELMSLLCSSKYKLLNEKTLKISIDCCLHWKFCCQPSTNCSQIRLRFSRFALAWPPFWSPGF